MTENKLEIIESTPMSNETIKKYIPNVKIITNIDLQNYKSIDELLPNDGFLIILFLNAPNSGHWVSLSKYGDIIEYFDSYGSTPKQTDDYITDDDAKNLGIKKYFLDDMLKNSGKYVIYNNKQYQALDRDISSCGRHVIYRLLCLIKGMFLTDYYNHMKLLKNKNNTYDNIVSKNIDLIK